MEFTIQQPVLKDALAAISGCVEKGLGNPILGNALIEADTHDSILITATNLDVTARVRTAANVTKAGKLCIKAGRLIDVTRNLPDVSMKFVGDADGWGRVSAAGSKLRLAGEPPDRFPAFPEHAEPVITLPSADLQRLIRETLYAVSNEQSRLTLSGVMLEVRPGNVRMVAVDGYRCPIADLPFDTKEELDVLIPRKALAEAAKLEGDSVGIGANRNYVVFYTDDVTLACRKLSGQFPNYEMIIPKEPDLRASFDVAELRAAIRRAGLVADDRLKSVALTLDHGTLIVAASSPDVGSIEESVAADYTAENITIGLRHDYISDFLNALPETAKRAVLEFSADTTTTLWTAEGNEHYRCVIATCDFAVAQIQAERRAASGKK